MKRYGGNYYNYKLDEGGLGGVYLVPGKSWTHTNIAQTIHDDPILSMLLLLREMQSIKKMSIMFLLLRVMQLIERLKLKQKMRAMHLMRIMKLIPIMMLLQIVLLTTLCKLHFWRFRI